MTMTVAITKPVVTHVTCSTVTPSDPMRCGTATLTIDASIAPINVPNVMDTVTSHLLTGGRSAAACGRVIVPAVIGLSHGMQNAERRTMNEEAKENLSPFCILHSAFCIHLSSLRPLHHPPNLARRVLQIE